MKKHNLPSDAYAKWATSVHFQARAKGDASAPTCNSCHGNHGAAPPEVGSVANVCGTCHATFAEKLKAINLAGNLAFLSGDHAAARSFYEERLALSREIQTELAKALKAGPVNGGATVPAAYHGQPGIFLTPAEWKERALVLEEEALHVEPTAEAGEGVEEADFGGLLSCCKIGETAARF